MNRLVQYAACAVAAAALPLLAQNAPSGSGAKKAAEVPPPAVVVLKAATSPTPAPATVKAPPAAPDSPLVAAAKRAKRAATGSKVSITNDTLVRSGMVNFAPDSAAHLLSVPPAETIAPSPGVSVADQMKPFTPAFELAPRAPVKPAADAATQKRRIEQMVEAYDSDGPFSDADPARVEKMLDEAAKNLQKTPQQKPDKPQQ